MIKGYCESKIGKSHLLKNQLLQDYSKSIIINDNLAITAIADGVGSSKKSDIAAKIAVESVIDYLSKKALESNNYVDIIRESFFLARANILKNALDLDLPEECFDTTLDAVIFTSNEIYFGHCGDGGIIGLTLDGLYEPITARIKGTDGISVIPLRFGEKYWDFGKAFSKYSSVMLATDGVYDQIVINSIGIYVKFAELLMNLADQKYTDDELINHKNQAFEFLYASTSVTDDLTISVLYDYDKIPLRQSDDYYKIPDWKKLEKNQRDNLYINGDKK